MAVHIDIKGREVTNPVAKALIGIGAILFSGLVAAAVIFIILPLVGVFVTLSVGLVGVVLVALGVGIPVLILGRVILRVLLAPFTALRGRSKQP